MCTVFDPRTSTASPSWWPCHIFPGRLHVFFRAWIFQHTEKFLRANRYFASFAWTTRVRCEIPACLVQMSYLAYVPHPRVAHERHVLDTDNIHALRDTSVWTAWHLQGSCAQDARGCEHIKLNIFPISGKNLSVLYRNLIDLLMSEIIYQ